MKGDQLVGEYKITCNEDETITNPILRQDNISWSIVVVATKTVHLRLFL